MKNILLLLTAVVLISSCRTEFCKQTVSYTKATAIYGNMQDLRNVETNLSVQSIKNPGKLYVGENYLLIGEEGLGIHVVDNSNPTNPILTNFINIPQNKEFYVEGSMLYAESGYDVVEYDISNLQNVVVRSRAEDVFSSDIRNDKGEQLLGFTYELVSEELPCDSPIQSNDVNFFSWNNDLIPASAVPASFAGNSNGAIATINRIAYSDDHVYLINSRDMFVLSAENGLVLENRMDNIGWEMETIYPYEDNLFIGTQTNMLIYSLDSPDAPSYRSRFDHAQACDPVLPTEGFAYVTLRAGSLCQGFSNELDVVDLSNIDNPQLHKVIQLDSPYGMSKSGDVLYVGQGSNGLAIFDITDRSNPLLIRNDKSVEAYDIIAHPTATNRILISGTNGLAQYEVDNTIEALTLLSNISY
jgi:hypothetical protein